MKKAIIIVFTGLHCIALSQPKSEKLTVEKIMSDPKWIGTSPSRPYWSMDGQQLFFSWNPEQAISDSVYAITVKDLTPRKTTMAERQQTLTPSSVRYNKARTAYVFTKDGDIFYKGPASKTERTITKTTSAESNPQFLTDGRIAYLREQNFFAFDPLTGSTEQLSNFLRGSAPREAGVDGRVQTNSQEKWLQEDQLRTSEVLRIRKHKRDLANEAAKKFTPPSQIKNIYIEDKILTGQVLSPDGRFISYRLGRPTTGNRSTIIPNYVTESGFTTDIPGRTKVGATFGQSEFYVFDRIKDTVLQVKTNSIAGIRDLPDFMKESKITDSALLKTDRAVNFSGPYWNDVGTSAVVEIWSQDNKDRWIMKLDPEKASLLLLDRQRDEAWIGGPGIFASSNAEQRWIDDQTFWFHSEKTGYSHLYTVNVNTGAKVALTSGPYEVQQAELSRDRKYFFITTNQVHPGEQHFYRLPVQGGTAEKITNTAGAHQVLISPDEKNLAVLYSYTNKPWELFIQENKPNGKSRQVTSQAASEAFKAYAWRDPELVSFTARDGAKVYARLYRPAQPAPSKPAVIFVHGAGYLQNAHKWWSQYFREYMFNNLLADNGYTVMDIDYRGSAGYGRDWRTGIYRNMGGKDLSDHVDAARYMVENLGVDPKRIGICGGSYGGFITLMAMFREPDVFAAGAGLRSVTDWAHYNHGYTSNILNQPFSDSLAYKRSSPIYYAEGLKGHLLMCHGMVDVNVHFQDIVRLTQRLIELGKDNWELAVYPLEDHAFIEPSSWTDEYKRVFKLFEKNLK